MKNPKHRKQNPYIELTVDRMNESGPAACVPYLWIVRMADRSGCALDCDNYTSEEAPRRLHEFLDELGIAPTATVYEAIDCKLHDIVGEDAVDAIFMAILRYFESDDCKAENTFYDAPCDVGFIVRTAWDGQVIRFTLHPDSRISFPDR